MKYGTRTTPEITFARRTFRVSPSNGREPQTSTYSTTPKLCRKKKDQLQKKNKTTYNNFKFIIA